MASYDITYLNSLEQDTVGNSYNSLIQIDATHYMLAYADDGLHGYIKTFSMDGNYALTELNSVRFESGSYGFHSSLVKIDATHFILAYTNSSYNGVIKTFSIDGSYNITILKSLTTFDDSGNHAHSNTSFAKIDETHYILAYRGSGNDGYITTFAIDGSYTPTVVNTLEHQTTDVGAQNSLIQIDSTHYMLAYNDGVDGHGFVKTFAINGSFVISEIDSLEHNASITDYSSLTKIDATHYALAFRGTDNDGFIKTLLIDGSYNISEINVLEHDTTLGAYNSLVKINDTHLMLAYTNGYVTLKTFSVDGSYALAQIDSQQEEYQTSPYNSLIQIDELHYALAYSGTDGDGFIKTYSIEISVGPANLKSYNTNLKANIKTINTNPIANVKSLNTNV